MSGIKNLFEHMFRTLDEFGMMDNRAEEVMAFATGLRDGELDAELDANKGAYVTRTPYEDSALAGFYKQGYMHGYRSDKDEAR